MKILYLHQYFVTPSMVGAIRSYEMGRRLVDLGHEVTVVTSDQKGGKAGSWRQSIESGIKVYWASLSYSNNMNFIRRIMAFICFAVMATHKSIKLKADVIYATSTPLTIAIPALIVSTLKRVPFVFEVRDMWPDVPIAIGAIRNPVLIWLARRLELITYRKAVHIVVLSPGMKSDIIARGIPEDKITVITQGCDPSLFSTPDGSSPRSEFDWLGARKMVLYAGTIGLANGVDYLVRLASQVRDIDPEARFVIIGAGKQLASIIEQAKTLRVLNDNFFILNPMSKSDLVRWALAADMHIALFTGPRVIWKDAAQNKFFDAVAVGKSIANNFDGWQSQFAVREEIGIILDPQDMKKAAVQLIDALNNKAWLAAVPGKARFFAEGIFNWQRLALLLEKTLLTAADADVKKVRVEDCN